MGTTTENRLSNGRMAIERAGGVSKVAKKMGYRNPSFLVQIFGPNPTRQPSEKVARRMEEALGLRHMSLDAEPRPMLPEPTVSPINADQLTKMLALVNRLVEEEGVRLPADKFAHLVSMAYEDDSPARDTRIRQVVRMFR